MCEEFNSVENRVIEWRKRPQWGFIFLHIIISKTIFKTPFKKKTTTIYQKGWNFGWSILSSEYLNMFKWLSLEVGWRHNVGSNFTLESIKLVFKKMKCYWQHLDTLLILTCLKCDPWIILGPQKVSKFDEDLQKLCIKTFEQLLKIFFRTAILNMW